MHTATSAVVSFAITSTALDVSMVTLERILKIVVTLLFFGLSILLSIQQLTAIEMRKLLCCWGESSVEDYNYFTCT